MYLDVFDGKIVDVLRARCSLQLVLFCLLEEKELSSVNRLGKRARSTE
jgi:hypothetical protein